MTSLYQQQYRPVESRTPWSIAALHSTVPVASKNSEIGITSVVYGDTYVKNSRNFTDLSKNYTLVYITGMFEALSLFVSSIGATIAPMTSLPIQDGGPHDFRSKMAAPTTSDPRWRLPRLQIQDGGPTKSDTRWRPL